MRRRELAGEIGGEIGFVVVTQGTALASQRGREVALTAGDAVLLRNDEVGSFVHFPSTARHISFSIPESVLAPMVPNLSSLCARTVPAENTTLRLLLSYLRLLEENDELITPQARQATGHHIHDLVALTIGATHEAAEVAGGRGVAAARLRAVKDDILANLGHRDLSIDMLARRQGISPRYFRKLFETEGTTFSEFVLGQRLARAYRILADQRFAHLTISAVAYEAGFGDLSYFSYFNRVFRRHYGATPSQTRALGRIGATGDGSDEHR